MSKLTQKQAVFNAIMSVFAEQGIGYEENADVRPLMTKELRGQVNNILCEGFKAGTIEFKDTEANKAKLSDDKALRSYVSGLQSNWLDKDERLNGAVKHVIKNPGSRTGQSDDQIKAMRQLLKTVNTEAERAEIQGFIDDRLAAIAKTKPAKTVKVNVDDLPEALRAKYSV